MKPNFDVHIFIEYHFIALFKQAHSIRRNRKFWQTSWAINKKFIKNYRSFLIKAWKIEKIPMNFIQLQKIQ